MKLGPAANCQTLVINEGTIRSDAAFAGAITRLSKPIETVGSPSPITPFTKPASRNVSVATAREKGWMEGIVATVGFFCAVIMRFDDRPHPPRISIWTP